MRSHRTLIPLALVLMSSALGCSMPTATSESAAQGSSASTSSGLAATISVTKSGSSYTATMTVSNGSAEAVTNWQVLVNMEHSTATVQWPGPSGSAAVTGAFVNDLGTNTLFMPTSATATIAAGKTQTVTWSGTYAGTAPSVVSVDGVASGTAYAGNPADGIDPVALTAATTAFKMAIDYEKGKLPNTGDSLYTTYDQTIWSAQTFRVASSNAAIEFDPGAPGYAFVPNSAKADLAVAQLDPTVASYLTAGLVSCFSVSNGAYLYAFRADFLKAFAYPTSHSGSVTNSDGSVDNFTVSGAPQGRSQEVVTLKATSGPTAPDFNFGILRYTYAKGIFPNYGTAVYPKFNGSDANIGTNPSTWHGHYSAACSPFNGPGGSTNPYLVINQNGASVAAWFLGVGTQCQNGCSGTLVIDPIPYTMPAAYYDTSPALVGPQANPFGLTITNLYADPAHAGQWATRTVSGVQQWGTFSGPVNVFGTTVYQYVKQM